MNISGMDAWTFLENASRKLFLLVADLYFLHTRRSKKKSELMSRSYLTFLQAADFIIDELIVTDLL